ncbi:MAG: hypothetical protein IPK82_17890 [Polyangiaceae bacterium]|nr:hypothetical protein [Polyangiaceae bacterium]
MSEMSVFSRCECQATLSAALDEKRHVLSGSATLRGKKERAAAHSIGADGERFDVGWLCPFCNRNTLRSFHVDAIRKSA